MSDQTNWGIRTDDFEDYLLGEKKQGRVNTRRHQIVRASDLLGPGFSRYAIPLDDFNDSLATYNGYFSSVAGASNAPNYISDFVGHVASDSALGGTQTFTDMTTGIVYRRRFNRAPAAPTVLTWTAWTAVPEPPGEWQLATLVNGWANIGDPWQSMRYRLESATGDVVRLEGLVVSGATTAGVVLTTLAAGYRPPPGIYTPALVIDAAGAFARLFVLDTGEVVLYGASAVGTSICVTFPITPI